MRRAMTASSSRAESCSSSAILASLASRSRRRSTARPSRMLSAAITVPIAVSRKTGATASWMTPKISGTWGSKSTSQSSENRAAGPAALFLAGIGRRLGARRRRSAAGGLLLRLLLLQLVGRFPVLAAEGSGRAERDQAGDHPLRVDVVQRKRVQHAAVDPKRL